MYSKGAVGGVLPLGCKKQAGRTCDWRSSRF